MYVRARAHFVLENGRVMKIIPRNEVRRHSFYFNFINSLEHLKRNPHPLEIIEIIKYFICINKHAK